MDNDSKTARVGDGDIVSGFLQVDIPQRSEPLASFTIADDGKVSGGSNLFSGLDLDFVWLTRTPIDGISTAAGTPLVDELGFNDAQVTFERGVMNPYRGDFPEDLKTDGRLAGTTSSGAVDFANVTFGAADTRSGELGGSLSLGEDGRITFTLSQPLASDDLYLYLGERFGNDEPVVTFDFTDASDTAGDGSGASDGGSDPASGGGSESGGDSAGGGSGASDGGSDPASGGGGSESGGDTAGDGSGASGGGSDPASGGGDTGGDGDTGSGGSDSDSSDSDSGGANTGGGFGGGGFGGGGGSQPTGPRDIILAGTGGDDVIRLGQGDNADVGRGNDKLLGLAGNDTLDGFSGDDRLLGGRGADDMTGGAGRDTFEGELSDFDGDRIRDFGPYDRLLVSDSGQLDMTVSHGPESTKLTLSNEDGTTAEVTLDGAMPGHFLVQDADGGGREVVFHDTLSLIYAGYYGRAPDPDGYDFWAGEFADAVGSGEKSVGQTFDDISNSFAVQPETADLYPQLGARTDAGVETFLSNVYQYLFNREPDAAGLDYWKGQVADAFAEGVPVGGVIMDIISGAYNDVDAGDAEVLGNKSQVATGYRSAFEVMEETWEPAENLDSARGAVRDVDETDTSVEAAFDEIAALFSNPPDALLG